MKIHPHAYWDQRKRFIYLEDITLNRRYSMSRFERLEGNIWYCQTNRAYIPELLNIQKLHTLRLLMDMCLNPKTVERFLVLKRSNGSCIHKFAGPFGMNTTNKLFLIRAVVWYAACCYNHRRMTCPALWSWSNTRSIKRKAPYTRTRDQYCSPANLGWPALSPLLTPASPSLINCCEPPNPITSPSVSPATSGDNVAYGVLTLEYSLE